MASVPVRVITKNVRAQLTPPLKTNEEPWPQRKARLIDELVFNALPNPSTLICCQEPIKVQVNDILAGLQRYGQWTYYGASRGNSLPQTVNGLDPDEEYNPIFFRSDIWQFIDGDTVWLSPTPDQPGSKYSSSQGCPRIISMATLKHIATGLKLRIWCTHFDNVEESDRQKAAVQVNALAKSNSDLPLILAGDLNSTPSDIAYQTIVEGNQFTDVKPSDYVTLSGEAFNTYTGFFPNDDGGPRRIDFIFYNHIIGNMSAPVQNFGYLANTLGAEDIINSDHRAVVADFLLEPATLSQRDILH